MDSIAPSAFFHHSSGRIRLAPALFAEEAKNHDRATKPSLFRGVKTIQGRQEQLKNASAVLFT